MFDHLQITNPRERTLVGAADMVVGLWSPLARLHSGVPHIPPQRVLLLRLERIGDLLMVVGAVARLRQLLPDAEINLVTGSWNAALAAMIPAVDRTEILDAHWLSREADALTFPQMMARAWSWRSRKYDLALNFEPDIRSNLLLWLSGARRRVGYWSGGGGGLLTESTAYDPRRHVSDNALRLVGMAAGQNGGEAPGSTDASSLLSTTPPARVERLLQGRHGRLIGLHASGGRAIKQWPVDRFRELAGRFITEAEATVVFTGSVADRELVADASQGLPLERVINAAGELELPELAWLLGRLHLFVTGDTGPMHLAHLVGTPIIAIFGPSDPVRYGPRGRYDRVVRVDLPCSPCNRIRQPPDRCRGVTPDCLAGVSVAAVYSAAEEALRAQSEISDLRGDPSQ